MTEYLAYHDNRRDDPRRESLLRLGHALIKVKNDLAFFPSTRLDPNIRKVLVFCIATLKEFEVKKLNLKFLDKVQDVYPLANLYNLGIQIMALLEIQNVLYTQLCQWKQDVGVVQTSFPTGSDIGIVLADVHEFLGFSTLTNRIHPFHTLTESSIKRAVQIAKHSEFLADASHTVSILQAAFSIQSGLEALGASNTKDKYVVSDAVTLSQTTIFIARDWYKNHELSMSTTEKEIRQEARLPVIPFDNLLTWFINARRRILVAGQTISPALKVVVHNLITSDKKPPPSHVPMDDSNYEFHYNIPLTQLIAEFLDELGEVPKSLLPLKHLAVDPPLPESRSPISFDFLVNTEADRFTQIAQNLLQKIYRLFNTTIYRCLQVTQGAHWLSMREQYEYAVRATREIEKNYLRAVGTALATRRLNPAYFGENVVCNRPLGAPTNNNPIRSDLLEAVFEICNDPNILEEEYLTSITGLSVTQVHCWFLYKRHYLSQPTMADVDEI